MADQAAMIAAGESMVPYFIIGGFVVLAECFWLLLLVLHLQQFLISLQTLILFAEDSAISDFCIKDRLTLCCHRYRNCFC